MSATPEGVVPQSSQTKPGFYQGTGRRKEAIARVALRPGSGRFEINGKAPDAYFRALLPLKREMLMSDPFRLTGTQDQFDLKATISGGGGAAQLDALRLGIARALLEFNPDLRSALRKRGLLTRDPRMKERKKYGQKGARKRFQYSKR